MNVFHSMSPMLKALFFLLIVLVMASLGNAVAFSLAALFFNIDANTIMASLTSSLSAEDAPLLQFINVANQIVTFLGAALVFRFLFGSASVQGFWLRKPNSAIVLVPLLALFALPLIQAAFEVNQSLIPEGSSLEALLKPGEELAERMTEALLTMPDMSALLVNLFVVALVPAFCEEIAFRGVLQTQLAKGFRNPHVAIWVSAILFSFIHFQFYGFIPRMLLGAFFGYLLIHTGSLWAPIAAHFVNNAVAVGSHYILTKNPDSLIESLEEPAQNSNLVLIAAGLFTLFFWLVLQRSVWPTIKAKYLAQPPSIAALFDGNAPLDAPENDANENREA